MKTKSSGLKNIIYIFFCSVLCIFIYSSSIGVAYGQKKPSSLKLEVDADDEKMCQKAPLQGSQFCDLFTLYDGNKDGNAVGKTIALNARNDMIDIVVGQVDTYFKLRKDGRRTKIRFYETVLDFLRIGGELAVTIMNGERAKTIIGASLAALDTGRTKYDENFQVLQTQVLVNKMIAKRAQILTEILNNKDKPVRAPKASDAYSWYQAKNDLRRYLLAGTFDDALDTLVKESGADVVKAEAALNAVTQKDLDDADVANKNFVAFDAACADAATKDATTKKLKAIVAELNKVEQIKTRLAAENLTASSNCDDLIKAVKKVRRDLNVADEVDLFEKVNQVIAAAGGTIEN